MPIEDFEAKIAAKIACLTQEVFNLRMHLNSVSIVVANSREHLKGKCLTHGQRQAGEAARQFIKQVHANEAAAGGAAGGGAGAAGGR